MFDILSKLGEIKEKAKKMKTTIEEKKFVFSDSQNRVHITVNGKKDILDIQFSPSFFTLDHAEQQKVLKETIELSLNESEKFLLNELKEILPNIPGMNIF